MPAPKLSEAIEFESRIDKASERATRFIFGAQNLMLEELAFAGKEYLDRAQTETHLLSEFVMKMAGAHSVKDVKTMYQECGQHQLDFIRRDTERVFKHGERMIAATSNLINSRASN